MEIHPYKFLEGFKAQLNLSSSQIEQYGFKPGGVWFDDTETIIMGTFPPANEYFERQGYIHYSSNRNKFWLHIDAIFGTNLKLNPALSENDDLRIENALEKIAFLKANRIGFVDIFTKIQRKVEGSASDENLIPIESIFETGVLDSLVKSKSLRQITFVYGKAKSTFFQKLSEYNQRTPIVTRGYGEENLRLGIWDFEFNSVANKLSQVPIHGNILDVEKQRAISAMLTMKYL